MINLGLQPYQTTYDAMREFVRARETTPCEDEIWLVEHPPVFTQGRQGKAEHILDAHGIPIIQTDRGGQVTYHGPGQLVMYFLLDLKARKTGPKAFVCEIESMLITLLKHYGITGTRITGQPGIYVEGKKIASIGLRIKNGLTYHGISLNVNMDLTPFAYINPCGYQGLEVTQMAEFVPGVEVDEVINIVTLEPNLH